MTDCPRKCPHCGAPCTFRHSDSTGYRVHVCKNRHTWDS